MVLMEEADWDAGAGVLCSYCNEETFRLIRRPDFTGCLGCYNRHQADIARVLGHKAEARALRRTDFFRGRSLSIGADEGDLLDRCLNEGLD